MDNYSNGNYFKKNTILEYSCFLYWILYYLGKYITDVYNVPYMHFVLLFPIFIYTLYCYFRYDKLFSYSAIKKIVIAYLIIHILLYVYNSDKSYENAIYTFLFTTLNILTWNAMCQLLGLKKLLSLIEKSSWVILAIVIYIYISALGGLSFDFNIFKQVKTDDILVIDSTIEGIVWISLLMSILLSKKHIYKYIFFIILLLLLILAFGKRSLFVSSIIILLYSMFVDKVNRKLIRIMYIVILLPIIWSSVSGIILDFSRENTFLYDALIRQDADHFLDATNRMGMWSLAISKFLSFNLDFLVGADFPFELFFTSERYYNLHNTFLQIFLNSGYIGMIGYLLVVCTLIHLFSKSEINPITNFGLFVLVYTIFFSSSESLLRGVEFLSLFYTFLLILMTSSIDRRYNVHA